MLANEEMRFDIHGTAGLFDGYSFREYNVQDGYCMNLREAARGLATEDDSTPYAEHRDPTAVSVREIHWPSSN